MQGALTARSSGRLHGDSIERVYIRACLWGRREVPEADVSYSCIGLDVSFSQSYVRQNDSPRDMPKMKITLKRSRHTLFCFGALNY